ncbi:MAG TPA: hypothetical protein VNX61_12335 [Rhizomicrobium sp.]|nr:hypothetical protein [Rhizomicrobium sp.]
MDIAVHLNKLPPMLTHDEARLLFAGWRKNPRTVTIPEGEARKLTGKRVYQHQSICFGFGRQKPKARQCCTPAR